MPLRIQQIRRTRIVLAGLITSLLTASLALGNGLPAAKGLVFSAPGDHKLRLDLLYPRTPPPPGGYPLIISIHGGGWILGNRHKDLFLLRLTDHGYAMASIDYRLSSAAKYPAQIEDSSRALRWLVQNSASLHIDANRIGVTGASAGGQLALILGLSQRPPDRSIKAICALYPPTDLVAIIPPEKRSRPDNLVALLLGAPVSERLALARQASPISYIGRHAPPVLLIHGDKDGLVPLGQSRTLNTALRRAGANSSLIIYQGRGHAFGLYDDTILKAANFFDRYLKD